MQIILDRSGTSPIYRQIVEQVRSKIMQGELAPGSALPTVRNLALDLGISNLTVFHAYEQLKEVGLVESKPRQATRVAMRLTGSVGTAILGRLPDDGPMSGYERLTQSTGVRSMSSSVGDPTLFYSDEFIAELEALRRDSPWNFYYSEPAGAPELLQQIAGMLSRNGLATSDSSLMATGGGMQALSIMLDVLTSPGEVVLIQEPGRLWISELLETKRLVGVAIRSSAQGLDLDHARYCLSRYHPRAVVLSPDYGHSTGLLMPDADRQACLEMVRESGAVILEDGSYGMLGYGQESPPPIASLDTESVVYVGSFSYALCPGIRTGFLRLPDHLRQRAASISQATAISGSRFIQVALGRYIERGCFDAHLRRAVPRYRNRRDATMSALKANMPGSVTWTETLGGFSTWVTLARGSASTLYAQALKHGVAFAPGSLFVPADDPELHFRLSFGLLEPEAIGESVRLLAKLISGLAE